MDEFKSSFNTLVVGANGGIGRAVYDQLHALEACKRVLTLDRRSDPSFDLGDEQTIISAASKFRSAGMSFDIIFDATGALEIDGVRPERSMRELDPQNMAKHFAINAIGPAMLIKHLAALMPKTQRSIFATLGARVGSIEDNQLGGWTSYRAAKAAQNQIVRTAAIELARKNPESICVCLHPGTVDTRLTRKYATKYEKISPEEAADKLLKVLAKLTPNESGYQFDYDGNRIPS